MTPESRQSPSRPARRPGHGFARIALVAVATLVACGPASAQAVPDAARRLVERGGAEPGDNGLGTLTIEQLMDSLGVPGVSVAVFRDFEILWAQGYGVADVLTGAPVGVETVFQAASISKPVAAMASLRAVQDGVFGLDDDINSILTSWRLDGEGMTTNRPVTPASLMSHTSGLGDAFGFPGYDPDVEVPTVVEILEGGERSNVGRIFMEREPGVAYEYSGGGVTLQQLALADARGRDFADILRDDVLDPIGMTRSTYAQPLPPEWDADAARAHSSTGEARGPKWHVYPERAAAGLWTTPTDLARFAIEVQRSVRGESNRVLDVDHARRMITPVGVGPFAIGFSVGKEGEGWYFSHGGSNWGFRATLVAHLSKGYGLAIMTNSDSGAAVMGELTRRIQRAYGWDVFAEPVPRGYRPTTQAEPVALPASLLQRYVGRYADGNETMEVTHDDRWGLRVAPSAGGIYPMFATSETEFFLRVAPVSFEFVVEGGESVAMIFHGPSGRTQRLSRVPGG